MGETHTEVSRETGKCDQGDNIVQGGSQLFNQEGGKDRKVRSTARGNSSTSIGRGKKNLYSSPDAESRGRVAPPSKWGVGVPRGEKKKGICGERKKGTKTKGKESSARYLLWGERQPKALWSGKTASLDRSTPTPRQQPIVMPTLEKKKQKKKSPRGEDG